MAINPDQIPQEKVVSPPPAVPDKDKTSLKDSLGVDLNQLPGYLKQELKAKQEANKAKIELEQLETQARYTEKQKVIDEDVSLTKQKYADVEKQLQPTPKFEPTQANALDIAGIFSLVATMGVALGGSGKLSSINALNSMGGMLKGYQQGRKDLFEKEQKTFDKELASMKAKNDELLKGLERWNQLRAKDKEAAFAQGELLASQYPGVLAAKIRAGDTAAIAEIAHSLSTMNEKLTELRSKVGLGGSGLGAGAALKDLIGKASKDEKINSAVMTDANAVARIDNLLTRLQDPDIKTGVAAKLTNVKQQLKSLGVDSREITENEVNAAINNNVSPTDKNAVFLKDALFAAFEAERAAQGGRLTVQMMKQAGNVLDPTNYTKGTYAAILGGRRQYIISDMKSKNMTDQDINTVVKYVGSEQKGITGDGKPTPVAQSEQPKRKISDVDLKDYATKHNISEIDAKAFLESMGYTF